MKSFLNPGIALAAGLALAQPSTGRAEDEAVSDIPDFKAMELEELIETMRSSKGRWVRQPCEFGVPLMSALEGKAPDPAPSRRGKEYAEILCADVQRDYADGLAKLTAFEKRYPDADMLKVGLYFDRRAENADSALARLRGLDYDGLTKLTADDLWPVARIINRAGKSDVLNDLALDWSENGLFGALEFDLLSGLSNRALQAAVRQGRPDLADDLLATITSPQSYITLLTDRKFESIWPRIEARAGPNLTTVGMEDVELKLARLENATSDRDRFSAAAHALHFNGQFEEAIALAGQWQKREDRGTEIEEGDGWALNIQAYAYDSLGEVAKADAIFDKLAAIDPEENYWVVSFVINRASRLVGQGRWEEGLEATDLARAVADKNGTTYAKLLIARDRSCALLKLGRADEARAELAFMRENIDDGAVVVVQGLMCHGLDDEAAQILSGRFADPDKRNEAVAAFEVGPLDLFYTQSIIPDAGKLLASHPDLAAEYAKYVRPMPEQFIPAAVLKRVRLDLPDW